MRLSSTALLKRRTQGQPTAHILTNGPRGGAGAEEAAAQRRGPVLAGNDDGVEDDLHDCEGGEEGATAPGNDAAPGAQTCIKAAGKQTKGGKGAEDGGGRRDGRSSKSRCAVVNLLVEVLARAMDAPTKTSVRCLPPFLSLIPSSFSLSSPRHVQQPRRQHQHRTLTARTHARASRACTRALATEGGASGQGWQQDPRRKTVVGRWRRHGTKSPSRALAM